MATWRMVNEAAERFGLSRSTIYRLIRQGQLKSYGIVGDPHTYIDIEELERLRQPRKKRPEE